jgi:hypothetical protein
MDLGVTHALFGCVRKHVVGVHQQNEFEHRQDHNYQQHHHQSELDRRLAAGGMARTSRNEETAMGC